jgi:hypothetical protein
MYQSVFFPMLLYSSNKSRSVESNVSSSPQYRSAVSCSLPLKSKSSQITAKLDMLPENTTSTDLACHFVFDGGSSILRL